ncbi:MAG TPA: hypothetical protein VL327_03200 [Pyrinomonadaceae bacterium]|jgi:hypothetical protein|nr:hypothetical protein [Pyrinomonadaceae bacterium]
MVLGIGGLLMLICVIWFVVLSVQLGTSTGEKLIWVIVNILFQPIAGIIFFFVKKAGLIPMILGIIGVVFYGYGMFTSVSELMPPR